MPGFAEEVANANARKPTEEKPKDTAEDLFNTGMPEDKPVAPEVPASPPPEKKTKIKIGTQEFESQEAALKYAEDLEFSRIQEEAYNRGKEESKPKAEEAPQKTIDDEIEEQLFENPKEAIQKLRKSIKEDLEKESAKAKKLADEASEKEATRKKTWDDFYSSNSDLANQQEIVQFVLTKNWNELGPMKPDEALKELASRSRKFLDSTRESRLPAQELQSKSVVTTGSSGDATTTVERKDPKPLDFIAQLRKHQRRDASS